MACEIKGGAHFGYAKATWPLATLTADESKLVIRASILGEHRFRPDDVVEVRVVRWFPILAQGVQVLHVREDRPERIIFWTLRSPETVRRAIEAAGFRGTAPAMDIPAPRGFPLRWPFVGGALLLWNGAFLYDGPWRGGRPGPFTLGALALLFATSLAIRMPGPVQRMVLAEPGALARIRSALNIVTLVSAMLLLAFVVMALR